MTKEQKPKCYKCNKDLGENYKYRFTGCDITNDYEELYFCSKKCVQDWALDKTISLCMTLAICLVLFFILLLNVDFATAILFSFAPYMIRHLAGKFDGAGEIFPFILGLFGTVTIVYPLYKISQEIKELQHIKNSYK